MLLPGTIPNFFVCVCVTPKIVVYVIPMDVGVGEGAKSSCNCRFTRLAKESVVLLFFLVVYKASWSK